MSSDSRPVLYHDPTSEPCRAVHWLAIESGIEIDIAYTWLTRGEHRDPAFLDINPLHQVPAMTHGRFRLAEATAIMRYLVDLDGSQDRWLGATQQARARTNQFLSWHHSNTRRITLEYFLPALLMPAYHGGANLPNDRKMALRKNTRASLERLEQLFGDSTPFLGGIEANVADFFIASDLFALDIDPGREVLFDGLPRISCWLDRLRDSRGCLVSHAPWDAIVPRLRELLSDGGPGKRDCRWVADACLAAAHH
jgi:glutathione S-transferase